MGRARFLIGEAERGEGRRRRFGLPHPLDRGELHLLVLGGEVSALVAENDDRQRRGQSERGGNRHRAPGEFDAPALEQVPGRYAEHEDRGGHIAGRHGVDELGLGDRVEQDRIEIIDLHAHRLRVERRAHRILHPAIGDQNPQRREVRANGHGPGCGEMAKLRQLVPAEEEQADEGGFEEEGHQAFDRQRRAEDVADIMAVVAPVHPELELHDDAGRHPQREVDAEQRAPEFGHLPPDHPAGHHIYRLHDGEQDRQSERQRDEEEVVQRGDGKLQPR